MIRSHYDRNIDMTFQQRKAKSGLFVAFVTFVSFVTITIWVLFDSKDLIITISLLPLILIALHNWSIWSKGPFKHHVQLRHNADIAAAESFCRNISNRKWNNFSDGETIIFTFAHRSDAMAFKLGWG